MSGLLANGCRVLPSGERIGFLLPSFEIGEWRSELVRYRRRRHEGASIYDVHINFRLFSCKIQ